MTKTDINPHPPQKILIVRLSAHGDVVQTLPLLTALKQNNPNCTIGWLTETSAAPLLKNHPLIDHLHISHRKQWLKQGGLTLIQGANHLIQEIKQHQYDVAIDVQGLLKSAIWPYLAGIKTRWGNKQAREFSSVFYTNTLSPHKITDKDTPAILRYIEFADALTQQANQTWPLSTDETAHQKQRITFSLPPYSEDSKNNIETLLNKINDTLPLIMLAPATMWASKHWPSSHWKALIEHLNQSTPCNIILVGSPDNQALSQGILEGISDNHAQILNLTGQTHLADLYPLLEKATIFIGSDSALLHITDAISHNKATPLIIGLYGATSINRTGPIGSQHQTIKASLNCQPCFKRTCPLGTTACMEEISPEAVFMAIQTQLTTLGATS